MKRIYDLAIVGGGIAGLVTAELFSRHGYSVVLIEKQNKLISGASSEQHGWFHLGSLYTASHQPIYLKKLVRTIETLQNYYSSFPSMNIYIKNGVLNVANKKKGWFVNSPLDYYVVARNSPEIIDCEDSYPKEIYKRFKWDLKCKLMISRHERIYRHYWGGKKSAENWIPYANLIDYKKKNIKKPEMKDLKLDNNNHFLLKSFDIPMNTFQITIDIFNRYLKNGGNVLLEREVDEINQINVDGERLKLIKMDKFEILSRKVIISAGRGTKKLCKSSFNLQTVASPLIVTYPRLHKKSFVRVTPSVESTINHIVHKVGEKYYSVIGGGQYAHFGCEDNIKKIVDTLYNNAKNTFTKFSEVKGKEHYIGLKTEVVNKKDKRNYGFSINKIDENVYSIIPGKFSLSFNLAIDLFKLLDDKKLRKIKNESNFIYDSETEVIDKSKHNKIAEKLINQ